MKADKFLIELERVVEEMGYRIRKEKGSFKGDFCVLEGDKMVVMNKNHPAEFHVTQIVRFLKDQDLENMFIKPAVRKEMNKWIEKINK